MAVPTGNNIKLSDVTNEIYATTSISGKSLTGCHAAATGTFDPAYAALSTTDTLMDFRNYQHVAPTAWRAIDPYCEQSNNWGYMFSTNSQASNFCFFRLRLITSDTTPGTGTMVQVRKPDGTVMATELFRDLENQWTGFGSYDHTFMFDLSFNTTGEELEFFIDKQATMKFGQVYAIDIGQAGTAVRWPSHTGDDPASSGMTNCQIKTINFEVMKFDDGFPSGTATIVYLNNQGLHTILGSDSFYGHQLHIHDNPALTSADIDELINGIDALGKTGGTLKIDIGKRTSASDTAWSSLLGKSWTLTEV